MQVEILKQAPIVFLYNTNYQYAMTKRFSGFQVNPAYPNVIFAYNLKPIAECWSSSRAGSRWPSW